MATKPSCETRAPRLANHNLVIYRKVCGNPKGFRAGGELLYISPTKREEYINVNGKKIGGDINEKNT